MLYLFDEFDLSEVLMIASRRQACKVGSGAHSRRIDQNQTDFGSHYSGVFAELAVARVLELPMNRELYAGGDDGTDLPPYHGWTLQVKGTRYWKYPVYFCAPEEFSADVCIGVRYLTPASVDIRGVITREMFGECLEPCDFNHGPRVGVLAMHLTDISIFKDSYK